MILRHATLAVVACVLGIPLVVGPPAGISVRDEVQITGVAISGHAEQLHSGPGSAVWRAGYEMSEFPPLEIEAEKIEILLLEDTRVRAAGQADFGAVNPIPIVVERYWFDHPEVRVRCDLAFCSLGVPAVDSIRIDGPDQLRIHPPLIDPSLGGADGVFYEATGYNEPFRWAEAGAWLPIEITGYDSMDVRFTKALSYRTSLVITSENGTTILDPSEPHALTNEPVQADRWFEIRSEAAAISALRFQDDSGRVETLALSQSARIVHEQAFWFPSVDGTLRIPDQAYTLQGDHILIRGLSSASVASNGGDSRTIEAVLVGQATSIRSSGVTVAHEAASIESAVAASLILALLIIMRDLLARISGAAFSPLYTKLKKPKLLDHERRQALHDLILREPGITFLELHHRLRDLFGRGGGFGFGSLAYHLSQLERFGMVISKRQGRYRRFFENGGRFGRDTIKIALLQTPPIPAIVAALLSMPGCSQTALHRQVAATIKMTRQTVAYHLKRLAEHELVTSTRNGKGNQYEPTQKLVELAEFAQARTLSLAELRADRMPAEEAALAEGRTPDLRSSNIA